MNESGALTAAEVLAKATNLLEGVSLEVRQEDHCLIIDVAPEDILEACRRLRDDSELSFKYLSHVSGVDNVDHLEAVYLLRSLKHQLLAELRVKLPDRKRPALPSIAGLWSGANYHEREAFDLFGIVFEGHPDLRRILNREDLDVFPYRKDARPHRKSRLEWRWPGLEPSKRLPEEPHRRERS